MHRLLPLLVVVACGVPPQAQTEASALEDSPSPPPPPRAPLEPLVNRPRMPVVHYQAYRDARWLQGSADGVGTELVVHWEPWCPHCKEELPRLARLGSTIPGLEVIAVTTLSQGSTERQAREFLRARASDIPAAVIPESTRRAMSVDRVPYAILLKDGQVVWRGHPGMLQADDLRSLL